MSVKRLILSLFSLSLCACGELKLDAQDLIRSYGIQALFAKNVYDVDFRSFPGVPNCCPRFTSGGGTDYSLSGVANVELIEGMDLSLRVGTSGYAGHLESRESTVVSNNRNAVFIHSVDLRLADIGLDALSTFSVNNRFRFGFGLRGALSLVSKFSQSEHIIEPLDGLFSNGQSTRNVVENQAIPHSSTFLCAAIAVAGYDLALNANRSLLLIPELQYARQLTSPVSDVQWSISSYRIGLSVLWSIPEIPQKPEVREVIRAVDTVKRVSSEGQVKTLSGLVDRKRERIELDDKIILRTTIHRTDTLEYVEQFKTTETMAKPANSAQESGWSLVYIGTASEQQSQTNIQSPSTSSLRIEEIAIDQTFPLLNYVFFEEGQSQPPSRYSLLNTDEATHFYPGDLGTSDRLEVYHHILNIVGFRMKADPAIELDLVGCTSNTDLEKSNLLLAKRRAESLQSYLHDVWGIALHRLRCSARTLPERASISQTEYGRQENRRVELQSNRQDLFAPLQQSDTVLQCKPPRVACRFEGTLPSHIAEWKLDCTFGRETITKQQKLQPARQLSFNVGILSSTGQAFDHAILKAEILDSLQGLSSSTLTIPVDYRALNRQAFQGEEQSRLQKFSLILFDVRSSEITALNKEVVNAINAGLEKDDELTVIGYTDIAGDSIQNDDLARSRAEAVAKAINVDSVHKRIVALGNAQLYDARLPEGRLYTRTVDVLIEHKKRK